MAEGEARGRGRETIYGPDVWERVLAELREGRTLRSICRDDGMPHVSTVCNKAFDEPDGFGKQYARAREIGYALMADEIVEIADNRNNDVSRNEDGGETVDWEVVNRSRLKVDTRKWLLSKALPKVYGDRIQHSGPGDAPIPIAVNVTESRRRLLSRIAGIASRITEGSVLGAAHSGPNGNGAH